MNGDENANKISYNGGMAPNLHLIIHNALAVITIILTIGLSLFTYLNGRKKVANITASLVFLCAVIFIISHTIGINTIDPYVSRNILMFNLVMFAAGAIQLHSALAIVGRAQKEKWLITFVYLGAFALMIFFLIYPQLF